MLNPKTLLSKYDPLLVASVVFIHVHLPREIVGKSCEKALMRVGKGRGVHARFTGIKIEISWLTGI